MPNFDDEDSNSDHDKHFEEDGTDRSDRDRLEPSKYDPDITDPLDDLKPHHRKVAERVALAEVAWRRSNPLDEEEPEFSAYLQALPMIESRRLFSDFQTDARKEPAAHPLNKPSYLSGEKYLELVVGVDCVNYRGTILNVAVTLTFKAWGISAANAGEAFDRYQGRLRAWLHEKTVKPYWVYVWENGPDNGLHVHMALHLPKSLGEAFKSWNRKTGREMSGPGRTSPKSEPFVTVRSEADTFAQGKWIGYLGKGVDPTECFEHDDGQRVPYAEFFELRPTKGGEGDVPYKRIGVSQTLAEKNWSKTEKKRVLERRWTWWNTGVWPDLRKIS